jgi:hypothetical protein
VGTTLVFSERRHPAGGRNDNDVYLMKRECLRR